MEKHVLIVEDNKIQMEMLKKIVQEVGNTSV